MTSLMAPRTKFRTLEFNFSQKYLTFSEWRNNEKYLSTHIKAFVLAKVYSR